MCPHCKRRVCRVLMNVDGFETCAAMIADACGPLQPFVVAELLGMDRRRLEYATKAALESLRRALAASGMRVAA